jgi:hypothetical protein
MVGGKSSILTIERVKDLEGIAFVWNKVSRPSWVDRSSELADYRKIYGHCNVPYNYNENTKLANWVGTQRKHCRLQQGGKTSSRRSPVSRHWKD